MTRYDLTKSGDESPRSDSSFTVRVLRQDGPRRRSYWQRFRVEYEPDMNCISVLQKIAERPVTVEGQPVAPVVWECNCLEEVCGACTMLVNGRVRQACTALVDHLLGKRGRVICAQHPSGRSGKLDPTPFSGPARSNCGR